MGIVTVPVLENEPIAVFLDGYEWKWMTDAVQRLDELAMQLSVTPLDAFHSFICEDVTDEDLETSKPNRREKAIGWFILNMAACVPLNPNGSNPKTRSKQRGRC